MTAGPEHVRLVAFLGTGDYRETTYFQGDFVCSTRFMPVAAARLHGASEVWILATEAARNKHGEALRAELHALAVQDIRFVTIPAGGDDAGLWTLFQTLQKALDDPVDALILDITHGFRSQPFFAAACVSYLQALDALPAQLEIVYGAYEARDAANNRSPVWHLTPFMELVAFATGVGTFVRSGQADHLLGTMRRIDKAMRRELARQGERRFPPTNILAGAIERFADDLATLRIPHLLRGHRQGMTSPEEGTSSAQQLLDALDKYGEASREAMPAIAPLLERLRNLAEGLPVDSLHGEPAQHALRRLAERYVALRRYPEAAVVVREAHVSRHADTPEANEAGVKGCFDLVARTRAERQWLKEGSDARTIADFRNDIEHGGYRLQPNDGSTLRSQIERLVKTLNAPMPAPPDRPTKQGRTWFVSRHPGAREWIAAQGIWVDEQVAHLDTSRLERGDTVIGTLPVHLVAEVCRIGATYLHLVVDLPPDMRGRELDAATLEAFGARLEPFVVNRGGE